MVDTKKTKKEIEDEPGAEDRFLRGVDQGLKTPPKPFTPAAKSKNAKKVNGKKKR